MYNYVHSIARNAIISETKHPRPSLDKLLGHVVSEHQQVTSCPAGTYVSGPTTNPTTQTMSIKIHPLTGYQGGCPRNFGDFFSGCKNHLKPATAFPWYVRTRARCSCSYFAVTFARCIVPELLRKGITSVVAACANNVTLELADLEVWVLLCRQPAKTHDIEVVSFLGQRLEVVEATPSHNFLRCRKTGSVVDFSLGQLTGTMTPRAYSSMEEFLAGVPYDVLDVGQSSDGDIEGQLGRDREAGSMASPESVPDRFAERVLRAFQSEVPCCAKCFGIASLGSRTCPIVPDAVVSFAVAKNARDCIGGITNPIAPPSRRWNQK